MNVGLRIAFVVVLELPQVGHCIDAEAGPEDGFVVLETVRHASPGIEIAPIHLTQAGRQALLAVQNHIRAGQRHIAARQRAGIEPLEKSKRGLEAMGENVVDDDRVGRRIEVSLDSVLVHHGREQFPAQAEVHRKMIANAPFILCIEALLHGACLIPGPGGGVLRCIRESKQKIAESIAGKHALVEREQAVIVGRRLDLGNGKSHPPQIHAGANGVPASGVSDVVRNLIGAGLRGAHVVPANRRKTGAIGEVDARETAVGGVPGNIGIEKSKLRERGGSFNGEVGSQQ